MKLKDIFIIGSGGVGREVAWIIEEINKKEPTFNIVGFIDDNKYIHGKYINDYRILGDIELLKSKYKGSRVVIGITNFKNKKRIVEYLGDDFIFENIIHPGVEINRNIDIGNGVIIYPGVIMTTNIFIGNHVIISPKCGIGHNSVIKDYASLLWNVNVSGYVVIGKGALVGSGATIIQNGKIGNGATIGAGAVVIRSIREGSTNVGVPSREVKNEEDTVCNDN